MAGVSRWKMFDRDLPATFFSSVALGSVVVVWTLPMGNVLTQRNAYRRSPLMYINIGKQCRERRAGDGVAVLPTHTLSMRAAASFCFLNSLDLEVDGES